MAVKTEETNVGPILIGIGAVAAVAIWAFLSRKPPLPPPAANIVLSNLRISPNPCYAGERVQITFNAANQGSVEGTVVVTMTTSIGGGTLTGILQPGESVDWNFYLKPDSPGTLHIQVNELSGDLVVVSAAEHELISIRIQYRKTGFFDPISVSESEIKVYPNTQVFFSATGLYSDGTQRNITSLVYWSSSKPEVVDASNANYPGTAGMVWAAPSWDISATDTAVISAQDSDDSILSNSISVTVVV
jgi:hypothetical protein